MRLTEHKLSGRREKKLKAQSSKEVPTSTPMLVPMLERSLWSFHFFSAAKWSGGRE
jgi:hypothetical protein